MTHHSPKPEKPVWEMSDIEVARFLRREGFPSLARAMYRAIRNSKSQPKESSQ